MEKIEVNGCVFAITKTVGFNVEGAKIKKKKILIEVTHINLNIKKMNFNNDILKIINKN